VINEYVKHTNLIKKTKIIVLQEILFVNENYFFFSIKHT